ncbi:glutamate ABC transporter permease [Pollutimonas nitritireducens]|uniref:Glutamate ABC transporter permease n=1 Tax=Pollutimonas nitritireducens TaxID=2045209 RepID=A0A2N4UI45_9BURK|nr:amino acid ABC transporter permease [Pollutimonas nitritireducens]PLC54645.1 glutamate ABC transporter permease [Pollutimonas nitritireducens]
MQYSWDFLIFFKPSLTGEGQYWELILQGLGRTVLLSLLSWFLALGLGVLLGIARTLPARWLSLPAGLFVHCFRNTPLLVQVFLWFYVVPELLPTRWGMAIKQMDPTLNQFLTALLALTLYTAAKAAEVIRSGIQAVSRGQTHAASALGLNGMGSYRHVILPQAFRIIMPPLTSDFLNVFKNSSVALTIGFMELTGQTRQIGDFSAQPFEAYIAATVIYTFVTLTVIWFMQRIERASRIPGFLGA